MTVISTEELLFWMTLVLLFTLGAWERTSGLLCLYEETPFPNLATAKSVFTLRRRSSSGHFGISNRIELEMLSSRAFLLQVCLSLAVYSGYSTCKPLSNDVESQDPEGLDIQLSDDDLLEKEDVDMRMENLLGNMKEGFLKKLNLSDVPQEHSKMSPPQFMMELYNKYAADRSTSPQSDVIRSFSVQGTGACRVDS